MDCQDDWGARGLVKWKKNSKQKSKNNTLFPDSNQDYLIHLLSPYLLFHVDHNMHYMKSMIAFS